MSQGESGFGKRWLGMGLIAGLLAILVVGAWQLEWAGNGPVVAKWDDTSPEVPADLTATLQHTETTTPTVYLPMIRHGFPPPPPVFAVAMKSISDADGLVQAVDAGAHWVRTSALHWHEIEPVRTNPPTYNWAAVDEQDLLNAANNDLELIAIVHYTPEWAQKVPGSYCGPIKEESLDEFVQFLTAAVERYSAPPYNVHYWQLGNEPDVDPSKVDPDSGYGCWGDASDPYYGGRYYAKMLKKAYPAIRSADSQAKVLTGGLLLGRPTADKDTSPLFLEGILLGGGGPYFDILAFHAYVWYGGSLGEMWNGDWPESPTVMPQKVAFLRGVLSQYGYGDKVLMNTESALFCSDPTADCLETQAIYVARVYAEAIALRLRAQVYFRMINEGWRHTGLLLPDLTPKPVYDAYQASSLFLTGVQSKGVATGYPSGIEGYTFRYNDHSGYVDVLWSADGSVKSVTVPENGVAHDRYAVIIGSAGEVVQVDYSPVYVRRFP